MKKDGGLVAIGPIHLPFIMRYLWPLLIIGWAAGMAFRNSKTRCMMSYNGHRDHSYRGKRWRHKSEQNSLFRIDFVR